MTITSQLSLLSDIEIYLDSDNKYTPEWLHQPIINYLRGLDRWPVTAGESCAILDPTADPGRQFPADEHITEAEDCFSVDWGDRLLGPGAAFMNPPFSNSAPFLYRMAEFMESGVVTRAVTLTLAGVLCNTQTRPLLQKFKPRVIFPHGRINFIHGGKSNDRDVVFLLWGDRRHLSTAPHELAEAINGWIP